MRYLILGLMVGLLAWGTAHYGRAWGAVARVTLVIAALTRIVWSRGVLRGLKGLVKPQQSARQ